MQCVEDAAPQRHQRDEKKVGECDPRQIDGQRELLRLARKPGGEQRDHLRREYERERKQQHLRRDQEREDAVAEELRRRRTALGANARIGRNEGGIERAFGKNGAEMIGQPEGDKEGIGDRPGAEDCREHDVAHEAGQAREQRKAADGEYPLGDPGRFLRNKVILLWIRDGAGMSGIRFSSPARAEPPR